MNSGDDPGSRSTFLPLSFEKNSHEGKRHYHELTTFDHAAKKGHWKSLMKDKQKDFDDRGRHARPDGADVLDPQGAHPAGETRQYV
jgi:hypothetical protein